MKLAVMSFVQELTKTTGEVVIVDPRRQDYETLSRHAEEIDLRLVFLEDGRSALQRFGCLPTALWLVNLDLPDFDGLELLEMLINECRDATVLAVANAYDADDEVRTLHLGVAMYLCKPPNPSWLEGWKQVSATIARQPESHNVRGITRE